jgi:hypothetical protein
MSIESVCVRLQSNTMNLEQLVALAGQKPTASFRLGDPVSSRLDDGPRHKVTTAIFAASGHLDQLAECIDSLKPLLTRLANDRQRSRYDGDLVVALNSKPLGYMTELGKEQIRALAQAHCGLVLDVYQGYAPTT